MKGKFIMSKDNFGNFESFSCDADAIHESNADQLDLDSITDGRESITATRTVTDESENGIEAPDSVSDEQGSTQNDESAVAVSAPEATLDRRDAYYFGLGINREELVKHLVATRQMLSISMKLGGRFKGSGPGFPCQICGYDETTWIRDRWGNFYCPNCMENGGDDIGKRYNIISWVAQHQEVSITTAIGMIVQKCGFAR
jgi:hypothetical protein